MKILAVVLIALMSAVAFAASGLPRTPTVPQLQPQPRMEQQKLAATRIADPEIARLPDADRAEQCNQQARWQDLQGDDYRLFVIRCVNQR
jgi:hypothetical protein